jgi:hypothetical protein
VSDGEKVMKREIRFMNQDSFRLLKGRGYKTNRKPDVGRISFEKIKLMKNRVFHFQGNQILIALFERASFWSLYTVSIQTNDTM